jgi:hypothetical protein
MAYVEMVVPNAEVQFGGATDTTALVTCMVRCVKTAPG